MPYALIPDGFTLKKVTKAQEKAVSDLRRSTYISETIKNPTTVPILAGGIVTIVGGIVIDRFLDEIDLPSIPDKEQVIKKAKKTALAITPQNLFLEATSFGLKAGGIDPKEVDKAEQQIRDWIPGL